MTVIYALAILCGVIAGITGYAACKAAGIADRHLERAEFLSERGLW